VELVNGSERHLGGRLADRLQPGAGHRGCRSRSRRESEDCAAEHDAYKLDIPAPKRPSRPPDKCSHAQILADLILTRMTTPIQHLEPVASGVGKQEQMAAHPLTQ
jgi:hypothetical protein